MTPALPNPRYERKFIARGSTLAEVLTGVRRHPSAFREAYPARMVNNIYLDSPGRRDYQDHIYGRANRSKTRIRWYGEQPGPLARPALERKFKQGLVSGKESYALRPITFDGDPLQRVLQTALEEAGLPERLRLRLHQLELSLFNRYRRHYFLSGDGRYRLTVDEDLQFAGGPPDNGSQGRQLSAIPILIVELKFRPEHAEHAAAVTNPLPFRLARCSKYVLGIQLGGAI